MTDLSLLKNRFKNYLKSLRDTSCDEDKKVYLCQSNEKVYDFDRYMTNKNRNEYRNEKGKKSFDALYFKDKMIYCIEFKNQKYSNIKSDDIKGKYIDSLNELYNVFKEFELKIEDYNFHLYVVFKNPTNNEEIYRARYKKNEVHFGLDSSDFLKEIETKITIDKKNIKTKCVDEYKEEYKKVFSTPCEKVSRNDSY